ncbi:MAG: peptidoglycan-binding protein [Planctomycetes bacterium]|nr:peptidoglycan-binding protein [Planctomycetota bacterium]
MASIPGPGGEFKSGIRQLKAAKLKEEMEAKQREVAARPESAVDDAADDVTDTTGEVATETVAEEEVVEVAQTGPVGQGDYVVKDGECISSIAKNQGYFWKTIWNEPANSELKTLRKDPNVLLPGDRVTIPELKPKQESSETEMHHRFRRLGEPALFRIRLLKEPQVEEDPDDDEIGQTDTRDAQSGDEADTGTIQDEPRANVPYRLIIDREQYTGNSDANGYIQCPIPGNAKRGELILNPGTKDEERYPLKLGQVSPITEIVGLRERLANLGFECAGEGDKITPDLEAAITAFQAYCGLDVTGKPDEATRDKLLEMHGS